MYKERQYSLSMYDTILCIHDTSFHGAKCVKDLNLGYYKGALNEGKGYNDDPKSEFI